jgi:hypothetical protein
VEYLWAALIGILVGYSELVTRYRDLPGAVMRIFGAWLYVVINGSAAVLALYIVRVFGWEFGTNTDESRDVVQVLAAGLGSLVVLRSSLFAVRVGDHDVAVGPALLLNNLLSVADRSVDRIRATDRAQQTALTMKNVSFNLCRESLPTLCLASLQNVTPVEQKDLSSAIDALARSELSDTAKAYSLGLLLMNIAGPGVLKGAVEILKGEIVVAQ